MRDFQRSKVYEWEDRYVHKKVKDIIPFDQLQPTVNYVWETYRLKHPPTVRQLHKNNKIAIAKADRMNIWCPAEGLKSTILLHEIAHSMCGDHDNGNCAHRPRWVGVYVNLLVKFAGFKLSDLELTLRASDIEFNYKGPVI